MKEILYTVETDLTASSHHEEDDKIKITYQSIGGDYTLIIKKRLVEIKNLDLLLKKKKIEIEIQ